MGMPDGQRSKFGGSANASASAADPTTGTAQDNDEDDDAHSTRKDRQTTYSSWGDSSWEWTSARKEWSGSWPGWESKDWDDRSRPYLSHLTIPEFNGSPEGYHRYRYLVQNFEVPN